jgi:hypothetical protein
LTLSLGVGINIPAENDARFRSMGSKSGETGARHV